jgi:hypothetical protein
MVHGWWMGIIHCRFLDLFHMDEKTTNDYDAVTTVSGFNHDRISNIPERRKTFWNKLNFEVIGYGLCVKLIASVKAILKNSF